MKPPSTPDANKPLQTTLKNQATSLSKQGYRENSMSLQGTLGSFSSRSGSGEHPTSSSLILGPSASFQSKLGHLFCTDTSPSFQGLCHFLLGLQDICNMAQDLMNLLYQHPKISVIFFFLTLKISLFIDISEPFKSTDNGLFLT